ncbi:hypothetical protein TIFTF001_036778 [Ficus carica]|uniref:Uncharacterized protein n=1 Tax=Ficus carica TaxID=3494 RepID=A0AA88E4Y3_FICCA|nr:hypothetical protein TIFTF001_036778 [Ficus carica]
MAGCGGDQGGGEILDQTNQILEWNQGCCLKVVAYGFVYACVHYICACCMLGLHGFMFVHATLGLCRFGLGCMAALESRVDSCGTLVNAALHKVIQGNRVRRYAQGTYNQDHVRIEPAAVPEKEQAFVGTINQERRTEVVLAERKLTSYVYAVGKQPASNL